MRLARQVELLAADTAAELRATADPARPALAVAVNADSLATWVLPALAPLAGDVARSSCTARTRTTPARCCARAPWSPR